MRYLTLAVLGHVDHGKSALVRALTGIETDRLREEQERGISIALGFAALDLPNGQLGIIDVPGHERFVRTMIGGATGSDAALLVVDVREGVMPQTREHLAIAEVLGLRQGLVALTKCDLASPDLIELAIEELREVLSTTFLADAPIIETSALAKTGMEEIRTELDRILKNASPLEDEAAFFLPVDRVFSMSGHGTVVTGTLRRGTIRQGDEVELLPGAARATVRGLQSHGAACTEVLPGHRVAVNLRNVPKDTLARGDVLSTPESARAATVINVRYTQLSDAERPLKHRQRVRVLTGTLETFGRVHLLDGDALEPGESSVFQVVLDEPAPVLMYERFVLRKYSPMFTLGGGMLLGGWEKRASRRESDFQPYLNAVAEKDVRGILAFRCGQQPQVPVGLSAFAREFRFQLADVEEAAEDAAFIRLDGGWVVSESGFRSAVEAVAGRVAKWHQEHPATPGISEEMLLEGLHPELGNGLVERLVREKVLLRVQGVFQAADFESESAISEPDRLTLDEIEQAFLQAGLAPPGMIEVLRNDKRRMGLYRGLVDRGTLVPVVLANKPRTPANTIVFHRDALHRTRSEMEDRFGKEPFTMGDMKELLGITRKFLVPLAEHFDDARFTRREGDTRRIVGSAGE